MTTISTTSAAPIIVAESAAMRAVLDSARRVAREPVVVLLTGETGTGKDLLADYIHQLSGRRGELRRVNCGALPPGTAQSELFGHCRGAFTGAVKPRVGEFEAAADGTLFLNELCSLALDIQAMLLQVLETKLVQRLGETKQRLVAFRLIAAAQEDLETRLDQGRFRDDLYHRLSEFRIHLPPLRERPADLLPLATHFAAEIGATFGPGVRPVLLAHAWRGNVRELRATIRRAAVRAGGRPIDGALLEANLDRRAQPRHSPAANGTAPWMPTPDDRRAPGRSLRELMREVIVAALAATDGDVEAAAHDLKISRTQLYDRMRQLGIPTPKRHGALFRNSGIAE